MRPRRYSIRPASCNFLATSVTLLRCTPNIGRRQRIALYVVSNLQQPPAQPFLEFLPGVARGDLLSLRQHRFFLVERPRRHGAQTSPT
jgi:hypothetical protein